MWLYLLLSLELPNPLSTRLVFSTHMYFEESQNTQEPFWFVFFILDFFFRVNSLQLNRRTGIPWERKQRKGIGKYKQMEIASNGGQDLVTARENKRKMRRNNFSNHGSGMLSGSKDIAEIHLLWLKISKIRSIWGHSWCCWILPTKSFLPRIRTVGSDGFQELENQPFV